MLEGRAARAGVVPAPSSSSSSSDGKKPARVVEIKRTGSTDSLQNSLPVLGMSQDPERELDEALSEIKAEMEARGLGADKAKVVVKGKVGKKEP